MTSRLLTDNEDLYWDWQYLIVKHVCPKENSAAGLASGLQFWRHVHSPDFESGVLSTLPEHRQIARDIASKFEAHVMEQCARGDKAFVRRLLDAVSNPKPPPLKLTACAVAAWGALYESLGHRPNRHQLKKAVEEVTGEFSDRHWADTWKDLEALFP